MSEIADYLQHPDWTLSLAVLACLILEGGVAEGAAGSPSEDCENRTPHQHKSENELK